MTTDKHREAARAVQLAMMLRACDPKGDVIVIGANDAPMIIKALQLLARENVKC